MGNRGSKSIPHLLTKMCIHDDRHRYKDIPSRDIMMVYGSRHSMSMHLITGTTIPMDRSEDIYDYVAIHSNGRYIIDRDVLMIHTGDRVFIAPKVPFAANAKLSPRTGGITMCDIPEIIMPIHAMEDIHRWITVWPG